MGASSDRAPAWRAAADVAMACRYTFFVAGLAQTWHWGFHSCSGLSADGDRQKWGGGYEVGPAPVVADSAEPMPQATSP